MIPDLDKKIVAYGFHDRGLMLKLRSNVPIEYIHPEMQPFYRLVINCFDRFKESPTVRAMMEVAGQAWTSEMESVCLELVSNGMESKDFPVDLEVLKKRYNTQVVLKGGTEIFKENWDGTNFRDLDAVNKSLKKLSARVDGIYRTKVFKEGSLADTANEAWNDYKFAKEHPESVRGVHVGLREFDRITNGIQKSELVLIGGESSSGKSALAMNMALNAWRGSNVIPESLSSPMEDIKDDGANVLYFSIEMPYKPMRRRCDACTAGVPHYGIRDGTLHDAEEQKYRAALRFHKRYSKNFHILDVPRGCTMAMIESKYIDICDLFQPDLIVIDYISLMVPDSEQGSDWLNLGRLAEQMHEFCRTYETRVISPVQLNRPEKGKGKNIFDTPPPDQHRVGRSIMLTQNANILLNIETRKDEETRPDMVIRIAKMRDGEKGAFVLHKRLDLMRIYDDVPGWTPELYHRCAEDGELEDPQE